jgi:Papain-like cysteine protease AvrRpt2
MANRIIEIQQRLMQKYESAGGKTASAGFSRRVRSFSDQSFDIRFPVPLVPQQTGMSCWAAGAAMVVAWRENYSADPAHIAQSTGEWASYSAGLHPESTSIFPVWGLTPEPQQSYTVEGFRQLLETYGPLWVAGAVPGPHIRVVTGMYGDGTPDGTKVLINDPWQKGMATFSLPNAGAQYEETYARFVAETERLAREEAKNFPKAIYVARSARPRASGSQSRSLRSFSYSNGTRRTYPVVPNFRARSLSMPVDFDAPRTIHGVRNPSPMTCWAAATAMLVSYKDGKPVSAEEAVRRAGGRYEQLLLRDATLAKVDMADYLSALGLLSEPVAALGVERMSQMLQRFGAIWLTPDYDPAFSLDARIVTGIHGDGTPGGTKLVALDPGSGSETSVAFDRLSDVFERKNLSNPAGQLTAIYWPPDTLGPAVPLRDAGLAKNGQANPQDNFPISQSYSYRNPSRVMTQLSVYSIAQNPGAAVIAGIEVADAAQIGLAGVALVQSQVSASQGSFTLSYDKAQRLLTNEARVNMPGSQNPKKMYSASLFFIGKDNPLADFAYADVIIEWEGNSYGEIGTPIIRRNLGTSSEWSKSSSNIIITRTDRIPLPQTDPRTWPIVYTYEGTYDPAANGYFEFSGEFEINAFGGLKFNRHEVFSRSMADWIIWGTPQDYVKKGPDINVAIPSIPQEQMDYLRTKLG